jgi:WD40 repeat protein
MPKIAISYRRADTDVMAGRIRDRLAAHYGEDCVFMDIDNIPFGKDFRHHIIEAVAHSDMLLVIVGQRWLGARSSSDRRIDRDTDFVRIEVETALRNAVPIIPVLAGRARMPQSAQLPDSLKEFAFRNAAPVDTGRDFHQHMERLIRSMDQVLSDHRRSSAAAISPEEVGALTSEVGSARAEAVPAERNLDAASTSAVIADLTPSVPAPVSESELSARRDVPADNLGTPFAGGGEKSVLVNEEVARSLGDVGSAPQPKGRPVADTRLMSETDQPIAPLLRTLRGHSDDICSVVFSPNGRTLVSGSQDKTIKLWDAASGCQLRSLSGHSSYVTSVAFSPDGRTLASAGIDMTIRLWDAANGGEQRMLGEHSSYVHSVAFSPDRSTLASGSADGTVTMWDVAKRRPLCSVKQGGWVYSVAFSPDGRTLASGSADKTVRLWEVTSGRELRTLDGEVAVFSVAFAPDGRALASSGDKGFKVWEVAGAHELDLHVAPADWAVARVRELGGRADQVHSVAFSPDGRTLALGSHDKIGLWDAASGRELRTLNGHSGLVRSVSFSLDGRTLASGSSDKTIKIWDATRIR